MGNASFVNKHDNEQYDKIQSIPIKDIEKLLIDGYIRGIQQELNTQIVPTVLLNLVLQYWYSYKMIYCITPRNLIYISSIKHNDMNVKTVRKTNNINPSIAAPLLAKGICYAQKVRIPKHANINDVSSDKLYDIIFQAGGCDKDTNINTTDECQAVLLKHDFMFDIDDINDIKCIGLPSMPQDLAGNALVFSNGYNQLISVGGHVGDWTQSNPIKNIYGLSFKHRDGVIVDDDTNCPIEYEWKWNTLCNMTVAKNFMSIAMIESKLFVSGGGPEKTVNNDAEMYDFANNELTILKQMKYKRCASGVFYDEFAKHVYIGGGHGNVKALKKVEYYDINKDNWYILADTEYYHTNYPLMWKYMGLLFIASCRTNTMEYIDLRIGKKWNLQYHKYGIRLRKIFNINDEFWSSRLL